MEKVKVTTVKVTNLSQYLQCLEEKLFTEENLNKLNNHEIYLMKEIQNFDIKIHKFWAEFDVKNLSTEFSEKCIFYIENELSLYFKTLCDTQKIRSITTKFELIHKAVLKLTPKLDEMYCLLKRDKIENTAKQALEEKFANVVKSTDLLMKQYEQITSEIPNIYTTNGIQKNQIEVINFKFGITEQYENYKRKEIHISVLSNQLSLQELSVQSLKQLIEQDDPIFQRFITELRETIDLLISLKTDLIYNFDKFKRAKNAQTWFNEMASQSTRRAHEMTTNTPAIETETPAIEWQGSSYSTCVVKKEHI